MKDPTDPVEAALESLGGRRWPGDFNDNPLKDKIMKDMQTQGSSMHSRRGALLAGVATLGLASVGFAAAGGFEMVSGWFITVEINGEQVEIDPTDIEIETDGNGVATITIDAADVPVGDGPTVVTVTAVSSADGTVTINRVDGESAEDDD